MMLFNRILGGSAALFAALCAVVAFADPAPSLLNLTQYVNPFIGTAPGTDKFGFSGDSGDVFPGAEWPRGMVQYSPDTPSNLPGGYNYPDTSIKGFSLTHFSGRGCTAYQDVPFMPIVGDIAGSPVVKPYPYTAAFSHTDETAHPGLYKVHLSTGIDVELTATAHTGLARFTFPAGPSGTVLINTTGSVNGNGDDTAFAISGSREVNGHVTARIGCGSPEYTLYFVTEFDRPFKSSGAWNADVVTPSVDSVTGAKTGVYVDFDTSGSQVLLARTGVSYVSLDNARANLAAEDADGNFERVERSADAAWNAVLNRIQIRGASAADNSTFYTALYHSYIHPNAFNDANGQYVGFDGQVHTLPAGHNHYENISGWDLYRSLIPLQALLSPSETSDVAQSEVDDAAQGGGGLPRWEQTNHTGHNMCGDSQLVLLASAYAYGARDFDTAAALKAMKLDASDPNAKCDAATIREGESDYLTLGYIPGSRYYATCPTLEYSNDDFALSQFAAALGDRQDSALYLKQAQNWKNLFNKSVGYIVPRDQTGQWIANYNPASQAGFVEGSGGQYSWMVPFNLAALFQGMGGSAAAASRLDAFFTKLNDGPESNHAFMGNEPCEEIPWEYDWAGKPSGTQETVRRVQDQLFNDQPSGFPGNDDGGAISSWYVWSAIGLYPEIPGVAGYAVGSPRFSSITILGQGRKPIQIAAPAASDDHPYVKTLNLNSKSYDSPWIPFSALDAGAVLNFDLGADATDWGSRPSSPPPSYDALPNVSAPDGL